MEFQNRGKIGINSSMYPTDIELEDKSNKVQWKKKRPFFFGNLIKVEDRL